MAFLPRYKITLTAAVVIMALGLVLFQLLPEQMLMLFVDKSDAAAAQKMIEVGCVHHGVLIHDAKVADALAMFCKFMGIEAVRGA